MIRLYILGGIAAVLIGGYFYIQHQNSVIDDLKFEAQLLRENAQELVSAAHDYRATMERYEQYVQEQITRERNLAAILNEIQHAPPEDCALSTLVGDVLDRMYGSGTETGSPRDSNP